MARGNIYYITKDCNNDKSFDESDYYSELKSLGVDYVKNVGREESEIPLESLSNMLQRLGADVMPFTGYGDFAFSFSFEDAENAKLEHFGPKLAEFKKQAMALKLESVIRTPFAFDFILDDNYGDLVAFNGGTYECLITVDDLIRRIESGVTYYVCDRVILMH